MPLLTCYHIRAMNITAIAKNFVNLFYPLHCAGCKIPLDPSNDSCLCASCEAGMRQNPEPYCVKCGRPMPIAGDTCDECKKTHFYFSVARSACLYEGGLKELIHLFKYRGKLSLAKTFSRRMVEFIKPKSYMIDGIDIVTPVPMHRRQVMDRDFNHANVLGAIIAKELGIRFSDMLEKYLATRRQNELSREDRLINLTGAFRVKRGVSLSGLRILLVDDVMTTGATCSVCAKALLDAGCAEVRCLTLARGL